ncbi:TlpA family protein disulfide reductase [Vicingaceae bacterium]|nr:TlpA family protein disulfide reductase [Vicingaceae bacterium]MDB4061360.1 TlpA family protein disulfide reductase [Vicingaceae bacterium]
MKRIFSSSMVIALFFTACQHSSAPEEVKSFSQVKTGQWQMKMELEEGKFLPFDFDLQDSNGLFKMRIFNSDEIIEVNEIQQRNDSLFIQLPIFESLFELCIKNDSTLSGRWINYYQSSNYFIPVVARFNQGSRFSQLSEVFLKGFEGKYEVFFSPESEAPTKAIGIFEQDENMISGTFATETGDYRHLAGNASDSSMLLSTFDGSHAFLFEAKQTDTGLVGTFYSGTHWKESWVAQKNDSVKLRNPNELTFLKKGYDELSFSFPNAKGDSVSLHDKQYENKPVIVQIMGSWCPNCLDETNYLSSLYNKYNQKGLEVIAIAFERTRTREKAFENIARLQKRTGAKYSFLLGGATREDKAPEKLPMLNHIMSYPTAVFIDKNKKVRRIHTGFYGPRTGKFYDNFVKETEALVEDMLNEQ